MQRLLPVAAGVCRWLRCEEPDRTVSHLVLACNLVVLVHSSHVPATSGKLKSTLVQDMLNPNFMKKQGTHIPGVVNHKLWRGQLSKPVPQMPVLHGGFHWVMVVAQEVNGLAVLPCDDTQISLALEFLAATFGQFLVTVCSLV